MPSEAELSRSSNYESDSTHDLKNVRNNSKINGVHQELCQMEFYQKIASKQIED